MAYLREFQCVECRETKQEILDHTHPNICESCNHNIEMTKRTAHLTYLAGLPLEARIARIEEELYDTVRPQLKEAHGLVLDNRRIY